MPKTDNHNPKVKLDLRRYFLRKYHADGDGSVLDCCQGGGVMWSTLRQEFDISSYWGVDLKPKKGRLQIDSVRILEQPGWCQNIIDVDTYGSPWKHWIQIAKNISQPMTVFLTIGNQNQTAMSPEAHGASALGFRFPPSTPQSIKGIIARKYDVLLAFSKAAETATIKEVVEAVSTGFARYIGVRLEPIKSVPIASTTGTQTSNAEKEQCNV
jgi:hypothetical protein